MSLQKSSPNLHLDLPERLERDGFVFISYKREEAEYAIKIHEVLKKNGFAIWWDERLQCGQVWSQVLDEAVKSASCIVVLWSPMAIESKWVLHEASVAMARNNYAPARIEMCTIPSPYNQLQATDLMDWDGETEHPGINDLINRCNELMPRLKSEWEKRRELLWAYRVAIAAIVFGLTSLGILIWQTYTGGRQLEASRMQLARLDSVIKEQTKNSEDLKDFRSKSELASKKNDSAQEKTKLAIAEQIERLKGVAEQQSGASENLEKLSNQTQIDQIRNRFPLEPFTMVYVFEYPVEKFKVYADRLMANAEFLASPSKEAIDLLANADLRPNESKEEDRARYALAEDNSYFYFTKKNQEVGSGSTFGKISKSGLRILRLSNNYDHMGETKDLSNPVNKIRLFMKDGKFVKEVHCLKPKQEGDFDAKSVIDMVGREMRYWNNYSGILTKFSFVFSYASYYNDTNRPSILFKDGAKSVQLTKGNLGIEEINISGNFSAEANNFQKLSSARKRILLNHELRFRLKKLQSLLSFLKYRNWYRLPGSELMALSEAMEGKFTFPAFILASGYRLGEIKNEKTPSVEDEFLQSKSTSWLFDQLIKVSEGADKVKAQAAMIGLQKFYDNIESYVVQYNFLLPKSLIDSIGHDIILKYFKNWASTEFWPISKESPKF
jgi:hypothetical protein